MTTSHFSESATGNSRFLGMGKRSWMIVGGWTYLLFSVWVYLSEKPVPPTATELRLGKIRTERAALGRDHPWAGRYESNEETLELAPESGYVFTQYFHGVAHEHPERGYFRAANGALLAPQSERSEFQRGLLPIRWGRRRYLIPRDKLKDFANRINQGGEPRYDEPGFFLLRAGDEGIQADGFPDLPEPERSLLLERPLDATIVKVGLDRARSDEGGDGFDQATMIILGVGRKQGARPGMILHPQGAYWGDAEIKSVNEFTSLAIYNRHPRDISPAVGWRLSTRSRSHRGFTKADAALQVAVSTFTRAAPFAGRIKILEGHDYLAGAKKNGFSVRLTARFSVRSVDKTLRDAAPTNERIASLARNTGGNAVLETRKSEHAAGPRQYSKTLLSYRVEWLGQPLAASEFPYAWGTDEPDWEQAKRLIARNRHPYAQAVDRINSEAAERLLHLPRGGWENLDRMDVKDLTAVQGAAFEKVWGLDGGYGPVSKAPTKPYAYVAWRDFHDSAAAPELAALKKADPSGDVEYRRLSAALR